MAKKKQAKKPSRGVTPETSPPTTTAVDSHKKNTSLRLNKQTLKALKIRAIEQDTSVQKLIETLIENYLEESR